MLHCIASLIVNILAKQIRTNVYGKYWIAKTLRNLVNDTQFDKFSPSLLVITVKLLKICHHACTVPPRCNVPHTTRALYTRECTRTSMHSRVFHSRVCTYSRVSHSRVYPYSRVLRSRVYTHILQVSLAYRVCIHT